MFANCALVLTELAAPLGRTMYAPVVLAVIYCPAVNVNQTVDFLDVLTMESVHSPIYVLARLDGKDSDAKKPNAYKVV